MSSSIQTARQFPASSAATSVAAEALSRPPTPTVPPMPVAPAATEQTPARPSGEHILPEGLSARQASRRSSKSGAAEGDHHDAPEAAPVRPRPSSPPRQSLSHHRSRSAASVTGGGGRAADHEAHGEAIPMTPLTGNGSQVSLGSDAPSASRGAASPQLQRALTATAMESAAALPQQRHDDEISQLTRGMPGAFDPLPRPAVDHGPRAPGHLASLHAAQVPSPRDVNPRIDLDALAQKLPDDITGCVAYMLSSMRKGPEDIPALERLATRQAAVLDSRGVHSRDDFVSMLRQVQCRDLGTSVMHGMASASGFNLGTLPSNLKLADMTLGALMKALPNAPIAVPALITGAMVGFGLSVLDVGSGAAAAKTFKDAYFTRPPGDQLPEPLASANPPTARSLAIDNSVAAGASYGGIRNGLLRVPMMLGHELNGQPAQRAMADNIADPVGGLVLGGGGMRVIKNDFDVGAGRAGFQHFLARDDLGECVDHLQKPALEQVLSAATRVGAHVQNLKGTFREALGDAFASKVGWTSHAILSSGFGGLTAMVASLPAKLQENGLSEKDANITTQMLKFVALQTLYHLWGGALGAVSAPSAPDPATVSHA